MVKTLKRHLYSHLMFIWLPWLGFLRYWVHPGIKPGHWFPIKEQEKIPLGNKSSVSIYTLLNRLTWPDLISFRSEVDTRNVIVKLWVFFLKKRGNSLGSKQNKMSKSLLGTRVCFACDITFIPERLIKVFYVLTFDKNDHYQWYKTIGSSGCPHYILRMTNPPMSYGFGMDWYQW